MRIRGDRGDRTAPTLQQTTPTDNATGVAISTNLTLTFNEVVKKGTGTIEIRNAADNSLVQQFSVADYVNVTFPGTKQVIVNPTPNLLPGKTYYVTISPGAILDLANNAFAGISSPTTLNFTTPVDVTAPQLLGTQPADDAIDVSVGRDSITLQFDEVVARGSGYVKIYRAADDSLFQSVSIQDLSHASFSSYEPYTSGFVSIDLDNFLASGTAYYVLIDPGAIEDLSGNDFAGITSPTVLNFTTKVMPDGVAPALLNTTPTDDATNVPVDGVITLTFNEAVTVDVGEIRISQMGAPWQTIYIQSNDTSQVTISGGVVTIDPSVNLEPNMAYSVWIGSNVFEDLTGTWFPGTTFNFVTESTTTPVLLSTSPSDNATNVVVNPVLVMTFDQAVSAGTGNIEIHNANGSIFETLSVTDTSRVTFAGDQVIIDPTANLSQGAGYYVTVAAGAIEDALGIHSFAGLSSNTAFNFTTKIAADAFAPLLTNTSPSDGAGNVPQMSPLVLTFSEAVVAGSGRIELHTGDGALVLAGPANVLSEYLTFAGNQLTIALDSPLDLGESYYLLLDSGAVQDLAGNPFGGIPTSSGFNFTVTSTDTLAPYLTGSAPSDGYDHWPIDGTLRFYFSEAVQAGAGSIEIHRVSDDALVADIDVTDGNQVEFATSQSGGYYAAIDPSINLDPYTAYYVLVDSGAIRDLAGNAWTGVTSPTTLDFVTGSLVPPPRMGGRGSGAGGSSGGLGPDTTAPSLMTISPSDDATNVAIGSNIILTFNEGVAAGTGALRIHNLSNGSLVKSIDLSDSSQVQFSGTTITINANTDLGAGSAYYVVLESGAVEDVAGNAYAGFSSPAAFNFTTASAAAGLALTGNIQANTLVGGAGNDTITGLGGKDTLTGAAGYDKFAYNAVLDSTSRNYDTITDFDAASDVLDLWFQVTGIAAPITGGSIGSLSFDSDLASTVNATKLAAHHAVLYTPNAGVPGGSKFLIVDANGVAGYQAAADLVILLGANSINLGSLTAADFV